jgi:uncharacterized protein YraI
MNRLGNRGLGAAALLCLAAITCNMPSSAAPAATAPPAPTQDGVATTVALTVNAQTVSDVASATPETAAVVQPTATACTPLVSANTDVNIRTGPGIAYDIIGFLPTGGTAPLVGRNDANTWWYIQFAAGAGGHAWIAGSVTTASCLPGVVQVVAAPPLPTAAPAPTEVQPVEDEDEESPPQPAGMPDLGITQYTLSPNPPTQNESVVVSISVYNHGNAPAGAFTVQWWSSTGADSPRCTWTIPSLVAKGGYVKTCEYSYPSWYAFIDTRVVVDPTNNVTESNEANNVTGARIQVLKP